MTCTCGMYLSICWFRGLLQLGDWTGRRPGYQVREEMRQLKQLRLQKRCVIQASEGRRSGADYQEEWDNEKL